MTVFYKESGMIVIVLIFMHKKKKLIASYNYNTEEIIGNYDFDYIKTNHLMKDSIRRM